MEKKSNNKVTFKFQIENLKRKRIRRRKKKKNATPVGLLFSRVPAFDGKMVAARRVREKKVMCIRACMGACEEEWAPLPAPHLHDPLIGIGSTLKEGH